MNEGREAFQLYFIRAYYLITVNEYDFVITRTRSINSRSEDHSCNMINVLRSAFMS